MTSQELQYIIISGTASFLGGFINAWYNLLIADVLEVTSQQFSKVSSL